MKAQLFLRDIVLNYRADDCLLWPFATDAKGYGRMHYRGKNERVSRVVCLLIQGDPPTPSHQAAHICGKGSIGCVTPNHLVWKTPKENSEDAILHGTSNAGERHRSAKLTEKDVLEIRKRPASMRTELAQEFGVSACTISQILHRSTWKHIEETRS